MIKFQKPTAFYDTFERKGHNEKVTTYCPGCGHGTIHKLIGCAIDDLSIQDRTIFCSPVGCSVFAYYYFDTGNIQCAHGRAPAVATGMRRTLEDAIIISYQGDGDLAGIGTAEIIHAANRSENITVIFVNNAIYGMTGGQMAPTTLIGQKTLTTPQGRGLTNDGYPLCVSEVMASLKGPVYIERVSLATPDRVMKTKRAIRKALSYQIEKRGFSFVEILSPCTINWKMEPVESRSWIIDTLEKVYPLGVFRDNGASEPKQILTTEKRTDKSDEEIFAALGIDKGKDEEVLPRQITDQLIKFAGFGGQGVMAGSMLLANCAINSGLHATWLPSYGPEMRGGTANASTVISSEVVGSPVIDHPTVLIAMNGPALDAFEEAVAPGGLILVNSSIVNRKVARSDVRAFYIPATEIAASEGLIAAANIVMVGIYSMIEKVIDIESVRAVLPDSIKSKKYLDANFRILDRAVKYHAEHNIIL